MNILFFIESGLGNSSLLVDQITALYQKHKSVHAILSDYDQEKGLTDKIKEMSIPYTILPGLYKHHSFKKEAQILKELIESKGIDIVHVQTNWELAIISYIKYILKSKKKFKTLYTIHGYRNNYKYKKYIALFLLTILLWLFTDKIICTCSSLKKKFNILSYKIILLPLGIDKNFFISKRPTPQNNNLRLIYPAQFRIGKNQDTIIKAFAQYVQTTHDTNSILYLPGSGELLIEMKNLTASLNLNKQIVFPGRISKNEILNLYKQCNTAIIASSNETFGQCIVEPYVLGLNIITTNVGVAPDIITDQINGRFFTTQEDLTNILLDFHDNPNKIKLFGNYNYERRDAFTWDTITNKYLKYLSQLS